VCRPGPTKKKGSQRDKYRPAGHAAPDVKTGGCTPNGGGVKAPVGSVSVLS